MRPHAADAPPRPTPPDVARSLFLTHGDELKRRLSSEGPAILLRLGKTLGHAIGEEPGGGGPIGDPANKTVEELYASCVGAIRRRYERVGKGAITLVLNATEPNGAREALEAAVLFSLTRFARGLNCSASSTGAIDDPSMIARLSARFAASKELQIFPG